jgi:hypothetical protein
VSSVAYLVLALAICLVGTVVVMIVHRRPREGPHDSIDAFSRQLEVLGRFVDRRGPAPGGRRPRRRLRGR